MNYQLIICIILFQLVKIQTYADFINSNHLIKNIPDVILKDQHPNLFLHVDKTIYTNNEQIWFTGYLLSNDDEHIEEHTYLTVYLSRENTKNTQLEHKFIIESGISHGNILLPDTIAPGNYVLKAYTNIIDNERKPICTFTQNITVKSIIDNSIEAEVLVDNSNNVGGSVKVEIGLNEIKDDATVVSFLNSESKFQPIKKNIDNKYYVEIPSEELKNYGTELLINIKKGKEIKYLYAHLPKEKSKEIYLNFYPEGGNLALGMVNLMAWEAKSSLGNPINTTAVLFRNNDVIDTIRTEYYGLGKFKFIPTVNDNYSVKILDSLGSTVGKSFALPKSTDIGLNINLKNGVVANILDVNLNSKLNQHVVVVVHNNENIFTKLPLNLAPGKLSFKIDLKAMQKGISTITILDSLQHPILERLFFSHYDNNIKAKLETDKEHYKIKDSTRVTINISDDKLDKPIAGLVSIAVVQNNRIETKKELNIESYQYLIKELDKISSLEANLGYALPAYLEYILLVKGWRKYNLQAIVPEKKQHRDTLESIKFLGDLQHFGKPLNEPKSITLINDTTFKIIHTNKVGQFELQPSDLIVPQNKKIWLMVNTKYKNGYKIKLQDPLVNRNDNFIPRTINFMESENSQPIENKKKSIFLKEVEIKGNTSSLLYKAPIPKIKTNLCGDYLCEFNHLNCQIIPHLVKTKIPKMGDMVLPTVNLSYTKTLKSSANSYIEFITIDRIPYNGCFLEGKPLNDLAQINGIEIAKEFYRDINQTNENEDYESTVYWNHGLYSDTNGNINFSFKNSNIIGDFRIMVQGVSANNNLISIQKKIKISR